MVTHSIGIPYIKHVWTISKPWPARLQSYSQLTHRSMSPFGSFAMLQHPAQVPSTDRDLHGRHVGQPDSCRRSSWQLNITTGYSRWKQLPSSKLSLSGRIKLSPTKFMWLPITAFFNSSRHKEDYPTVKCVGWNS